VGQGAADHNETLEKYYGASYGSYAPIENLIFEVIPHPNTQFQALLSGTIDRFNLTPEQWVSRTNGRNSGLTVL
jgi:ABC-type transport system substrate-binding protein